MSGSRRDRNVWAFYPLMVVPGMSSISVAVFVVLACLYRLRGNLSARPSH